MPAHNEQFINARWVNIAFQEISLSLDEAEGSLENTFGIWYFIPLTTSIFYKGNKRSTMTNFENIRLWNEHGKLGLKPFSKGMSGRAES